MFWRYVIAMVIAVIAILIGIILGDYGPWYLSWFLGTGFMMLVSVAAGVLYEAQDDAERGLAPPLLEGKPQQVAQESSKK